MSFPVDEEGFEEEQRLDVRSCDERVAAVVVVRGEKRRGMEDTVWWRKKNRSRVAFSSMFAKNGLQDNRAKETRGDSFSSIPFPLIKHVKTNDLFVLVGI